MTILAQHRLNSLTAWLDLSFAGEKIQLIPLNGDAGFRRYFRFAVQQQSYIAVDAPPALSNNAGFVMMQKALCNQGIIVPEIIAVDMAEGFMCLSDLGDNLLANAITSTSMTDFYTQAIELLPIIATTDVAAPDSLALYDREFILRELSIFTEWLLAEHLHISLSDQEAKQLADCFELLIDNALAQPQVTMHRDYHSRNILLNNDQLAVIDFQDAVKGPVTYDIVSLLRDCYLRWPAKQITPLFAAFCQLITTRLSLGDISEQQWQQWFDLMGIQRHLKASGIFARLFHRDGKAGYLADIPLTLSYIIDISAHYPQLAFLHQLLKVRVLPALEQRQQ